MPSSRARQTELDARSETRSAREFLGLTELPEGLGAAHDIYSRESAADRAQYPHGQPDVSLPARATRAATGSAGEEDDWGIRAAAPGRNQGAQRTARATGNESEPL